MILNKKTFESHNKLRKYINAFLSYSAKTKRDGWMDRRTDRQTDGRGALQYLPSRAFGAAGDKKPESVGEKSVKYFCIVLE